MSHTQLAQVRHWRQLLLEAPIPEGLGEVLPEFLKKTGQDFLTSMRPETSAEEHHQLERWYVSAEGQAVLCEFTKQLWMQMATHADHAMPAHDARHAMFKVPAASLEYVASESVQGWERIGVLGALLHDHGRWAEERVYGHPGDSLVHARLSFLLGQELLAELPMPELARKHILLSALRHTSGAHPHDPMPLKLTVTADRDQLYGAEIVLRIAHHTVGKDGALSSFYGEKPGQSILDRLEHIMSHRLPGPLFSRREHVDQLWSSLATFFLLAENPDASRQRFDRILQGRPGCYPIPSFDWATEWELANEHRPSSKGPAGALMQLLGAPNVAPSLHYRQTALDKLSALATDNAWRLAGALAFVEEQRWSEDQRQRAALKRIARDNPSDRFVQLLGGFLLQGWDGIDQT